MDKLQHPESRDFKILGGVLKIYDAINTISFFGTSENIYWMGKFNECAKIKNVVSKKKKFKSGSVHAEFELIARKPRVLVLVPFNSASQKHETLRIEMDKCTTAPVSSTKLVTMPPAPQTKPDVVQSRHFSILGGTFSIIIESREIRFSMNGILYRATIENDIFLTENITNDPDSGSSAIVPIKWPQQKSSTCILEFEFHSSYPRNDPEQITLTLVADPDESQSDDLRRELADNIAILSSTCETYKNMLLSSNKNLYSIVEDQKQSTNKWIQLQSDFEQYRESSLVRQIKSADEIGRLEKVISQLNCDMTTCRSDRDSFIKLSFTLGQELKSKNNECRELRAAMIRLMNERNATKSECESLRSQNADLNDEIDSILRGNDLVRAIKSRPKLQYTKRFINYIWNII